MSVMCSYDRCAFGDMPILPALGKALVEISSDDTLIQLGAANVLHAVERVLVGVVLDEAEATGCLLESIETHHEALDLSALGEQLVDLLFGGIEGQIADVEGSGVLELVVLRCRLARAVAAVRVATTVLCPDQPLI